MRAGRKAADRYPLLFSPVTVGGLTLRNRVVVLPMGLRFGNHGEVTRRDIAFYEARARAGAGLVIMGGTIVHANSRVHGHVRREAFRRELMPSFEALGHTLHQHGTAIIGQLVHNGRERVGESEAPLWAPSPLPATGSSETPHAMTHDEIDELVDAFAASASNLLEAGFDGIEVHGGHGYLIGQFLSPVANCRSDEYGGSRESRMRFPLAILHAIRNRCGSSFALGFRISAEEHAAADIEPSESAAVIAGLARTGLIDYVSVAIGVRGGYVKDMSATPGIAARAARTIRDAGGLPVIASQRITHPDTAEQILASGAADLIGGARAHIADANWTRWARLGEPDRILPCVACMQDCRGAPGGITCMHNPSSGRELELGPLRRTREPKTIVVLGGGPAGLEAARVGAECGNRVLVYEREARLGGQVALAAVAPTRAEISRVVTYRVRELARLNVEIRLETPGSLEAVSGDDPDIIIVATGPVPGKPTFEVQPAAATADLWSLFRPDFPLPYGEPAVIIDDEGGNWETYSAAEYVAAAGMRTTIVTRSPQLAAGIPAESRTSTLQRLAARQVDLRPLTAVSAIAPGVVRTYNPYYAEHDGELPAALAVIVGPKMPDTTDFNLFASAFPTVYAIGDCVSPRRISHAIFDAHQIVRSL